MHCIGSCTCALVPMVDGEGRCTEECTFYIKCTRVCTCSLVPMVDEGGWWMVRGGAIWGLGLLLQGFHCTASRHCWEVCSFLLHCILLPCILLPCIALHCIVLNCIASLGGAFHSIVFHCIALHCLVHRWEVCSFLLHCIALHCVALHCIVHWEVCPPAGLPPTKVSDPSPQGR